VVVERDVVADLRGLADHDAATVVDEEATPDPCSGVDVDPAGDEPAGEGDRARRDAVSAEVEPVREPMEPERVEVRVEQHLGDARRRRVSLERGVDVLAGQLQHASHGVH